MAVLTNLYAAGGTGSSRMGDSSTLESAHVFQNIETEELTHATGCQSHVIGTGLVTAALAAAQPPAEDRQTGRPQLPTWSSE